MIWVGALVLFGYWIVFHALTALVLTYTPAPGATVPSFSQDFLDNRKANVEGTQLQEHTVNPAALGDRTVGRQSESGRISSNGKPARVSLSGSLNKVHIDGFPRPSADGKVWSVWNGVECYVTVPCKFDTSIPFHTSIEKLPLI